MSKISTDNLTKTSLDRVKSISALKTPTQHINIPWHTGLTVSLKKSLSSRVSVSALAMTGTMLTTLLRRLINSTSRGLRLQKEKEMDKKIGIRAGADSLCAPLTKALSRPSLMAWEPMITGSFPGCQLLAACQSLLSASLITCHSSAQGKIQETTHKSCYQYQHLVFTSTDQIQLIL